MITDNLLDKLLEGQSSKRVETDYIEEQNKKIYTYFIKQGDYKIRADKDVYVSGKNTSQFLAEAKQKTKRRSPQKKRSYGNYQLLSRLGRMYTLSNFSKLLHFLDENQYLIPVVIEAHEELRKRFPSEKLLLEVVSDPEADGYDELFAYIFTSLPVEDGLQRLNDLDDMWFLNELDRTNGLFNFNLRFI